MLKTNDRLLASMTLVGLLLLWLHTEARAASETHVITTGDLQASGAAVFSLTIDLSAATFTISSHADDAVFLRATVRYDNPERPPAFSVALDNATLSAVLSSGQSAPTDTGVQDQHWDISLSTTPCIPTDMTLTCSHTAGSFDGGGTNLRSCAVIVQTSQITMDWSGPVCRSMQVLIVAASGSGILMKHAGNANFGACGFLCSNTAVECGLEGNLAPGDHGLTFILAGSAVDLLVPSSIGAKVTARRFGPDIKVSGSGWQDLYHLPMRRSFMTENYSTSETTVTADITALGTQVRIIRDTP